MSTGPGAAGAPGAAFEPTGLVEPRVARTREELARALSGLRELPGGRTLGLVPTMGALHEGHRSLVRIAHQVADVVVVSIFVNPLQFGPADDLDRYPRTWEADLRACRDDGVAVIFAPPPDVVYPEDPVVRIDPGPMGEVLEGASRPGFFHGVLTVVAKLFHLVGPDVAVFGEKDAQQLALVRRMVRDLDMPVRVVAGPTVREPDGLALSSRNRYLTAPERATALALSRALRAGAASAGGGPSATFAAARAVMSEATAARPPLAPDYLALVEPETFAEVAADHTGPAVLAAAAKVGTTRLIDNVPVAFGGAS